MALNNPYAIYQKMAKSFEATKKDDQDMKNQVEVSPPLNEKPAPEVNQQNNTIHENEILYSATTGTDSVQKNLPQHPAQQKVNPYLENMIMSARPEELTLMLYDGAIKFMNGSVMAIETKNLERAHNLLVRVQDIFNELIVTLNMNYEISEYLKNLYVFIQDSLFTANIQKDIALLKEIISLTQELRDTWSQSMSSLRDNLAGERP